MAGSQKNNQTSMKQMCETSRSSTEWKTVKQHPDVPLHKLCMLHSVHNIHALYTHN